MFYVMHTARIVVLLRQNLGFGYKKIWVDVASSSEASLSILGCSSKNDFYFPEGNQIPSFQKFEFIRQNFQFWMHFLASEPYTFVVISDSITLQLYASWILLLISRAICDADVALSTICHGIAGGVDWNLLDLSFILSEGLCLSQKFLLCASL